MAKRKKKLSTITAEERLKEALVPENKQPYQLPCNWCWVSIKAINQYLGASLNPGDFPNTKFELYSVPSCANNYPEIITGDEIGSSKQIVQEGDVLLCKINPRINRVWIVSRYTKFDLLASSEWIVVRNKIINAKYIMWYFRSPSFREYMMSNVSGVGGSLMRTKPKLVDMYPVAVPPAAEQQRIVNRIESLFSKLDEVEEKLQSVLDSFETRRAAILHKAFTGRLTKKWRSDNGRNITEWSKQRFNDVATIKSNLVDPASFPDFPHIAPDNIEKHTGQLLEYNTVSEDGVKSGKHHFYPGQILYSKIRPYLSKVIIAPVEGLCSADMYPIETPHNTRYLWYYMLSNEFLNQASFAGSRTVLPKINQKELSSLIVILPSSSEEQDEIVRLLDDFFSKEEQAKKFIESNLEQIVFIKNAILTKAFHGELGTNNPNDEDAKELVKRILG